MNKELRMPFGTIRTPAALTGESYLSFAETDYNSVADSGPKRSNRP